MPGCAVASNPSSNTHLENRPLLSTLSACPPIYTSSTPCKREKPSSRPKKSPKKLGGTGSRALERWENQGTMFVPPMLVRSGPSRPTATAMPTR